MEFTLRTGGVSYTLKDDRGARWLVVKDDGCENWFNVPDWFRPNDMQSFAMGWSKSQDYKQDEALAKGER